MLQHRALHCGRLIFPIDFQLGQITFLFRRNLKREETSLGSHSSMWSREHRLHLQPGLVGLGPRPSWVNDVNFHFRAHSNPISNSEFNFTRVEMRHVAGVRMRLGSLRHMSRCVTLCVTYLARGAG